MNRPYDDRDLKTVGAFDLVRAGLPRQCPYVHLDENERSKHRPYALFSGPVIPKLSILYLRIRRLMPSSWAAWVCT
jgi:hypothetical protein